MYDGFDGDLWTARLSPERTARTHNNNDVENANTGYGHYSGARTPRRSRAERKKSLIESYLFDYLPSPVEGKPFVNPYAFRTR
jgi:hypothetical protein